MTKNSRKLFTHRTNQKCRPESLIRDNPKSNGLITDIILKDSSVSAVSKIGYAETQLRKRIWLLLLLLGLLGCSYQIYKFLNLFLTYPVVVSLKDQYKPALEFPAVTVCNLNRLKKEYEKCTNTDILRRGCVPPMLRGLISERRYTLSCKSLNSSFPKEKAQAIKFLSWYMKMDLKNRQALGHQVSEFIKHCTFEGYLCSLEDFSLFQSLKYGNCYTFKKINKNGEILKTSSTGYNSGMELVLDVNRRHYLKITHSVGVRVLIHDAADIPSPDEKGMNIAPGFETTIAIKQMVIHRLPAPYRDRCRDYRSKNNQSNEDMCLKNCIQRKSLQICGCVDPTLTVTQKESHCNMKNRENVCCLDSVQDHVATNGLSCDCPLACLTTYYEKQLSKAIWPSVEFIRPKYNETESEYLKYLRENTLRLKVYYSSLVQKTFEQLPMFENSEIFSHLGGELALWLGLSLFALFELVETISYMCRFLLNCKHCTP